MRYINNAELREWVKDSLRKAIFQKAHALAIQTGCEVLVKLEDVVDTKESQYYATDTLQKAYDKNQLQKSPTEVLVSGETGLPMTKLIDRASQSSGTSADGGDDDDDEGSDWEELPPGGAGPSSNQEKVPQSRSVIRTMEQYVGDVIAQETQKSKVHPERTRSFRNKDDCQSRHEKSILEKLGIRALPKDGTDSPQVLTSTGSKMDDVTIAENLIVGDVKEEHQETVSAGKESADVFADSLSKDTVMVTESESQSTSGRKDDQVAASEGSSSTGGSSSVDTVNIPSKETVSDLGVPSLPIPVMSPSIRPYQCGVCQKTFGSIQVLSRHAQTFHGMNRGMRYYCNICGQSYKLAQYLQAHVKMHDMVSVSPVVCKVCGMGYYSDAALRQHELTHSEGVPQAEPPHTVTSPPDVPTLSNPGEHVSESTKMPSPLDVLVQSKPNPRLQLSQASSTSTPKPVITPPSSSSSSSSGGFKPSRPSTHLSPPESKRFKSSDEKTKDNDEEEEESYHEPKQYHCLVCGMAFEEGEQLEEHVLKKHMQSDEAMQSSTDKPSSDLSENDDPLEAEDNEKDSVTQVKEEVMSPSPPPLPTSQSSDRDIPGTSESSVPSLPGLNTTFPPFSALDKGGLMMPPFSQPMSFPPLPSGPPHSTNPNITSVLEQALPGLLPGISLLSNPTQLPMAQAAASIAQSEGYPPVVSQDGRFTCDICGNSYKYNCTLKEHRLTHAQTPLFSCKICNQAFSRQRQLRDHMFRHSGAYPYHCKLCGKGFVRPSILRRHETDRHKQAWENLS